MLAQIGTITLINVMSIPRRLWMSLSAILASAIVVAVLLAFLAMADGFKRTVEGAGSVDIAILQRPGSQSELNSVISREQVNLAREAPGIARDESGRPVFSPELYVIIDGKKRNKGTDANLPVRGLEPEGLALRDKMRIVEGRLFTPGTNEVVVGRGVTREFSGLEVGKPIRTGENEWLVVGHFEAEGTVYESEIWADAKVIQSAFNRGGSYQVIRVRLTAPESLAELQAALDADPRLKLEARSERDYLAEQASGVSNLIRGLGWPIAIAMAFGALAGALNAMYASVASRSREIGTLRAIGFSRFATFCGTLVEAMLLATAGGLLGAMAAWLLFDGFTASTLGGSFTQVVFRFSIGFGTVATGIGLAIAIGLLGGFFPALRAARAPVSNAFLD
ncbi:MAG: ABC transporter permease [Rhodothalassiaceae bacterium]